MQIRVSAAYRPYASRTGHPFGAAPGGQLLRLGCRPLSGLMRGRHRVADDALGSAFGALSRILLLDHMRLEKPVHGFGSGGQHRPQFAPVDNLGGPGARVARKPCYLFDRHS